MPATSTIVPSTVGHMYSSFKSAPAGRSDWLGACRSDHASVPGMPMGPQLSVDVVAMAHDIVTMAHDIVTMAHQLVPVHLECLRRPQPQADDGETV